MQDLKYSTSPEMCVQEERLECKNRRKLMTIGMPKEMSKDENRVVLIPDSVKLLVDHGHRVIFETGAGTKAHFTDREYAEAGAEIALSHDEVFKADLVLKVAPLELYEIEYLDKGKIVMSSWQLPSRDKSYFLQLMAKKTTAIAFEQVQDKSKTFPLVRSMSEITGNAAMMIASQYLCNSEFGNGTMLGGVPGVAPTEVVIIGAGTVSLNACRVALGMGCQVKVLDNAMYKLRSLQNHLQNRIYTSTLQPKILEQSLQNADIVIAAKHSCEGVSPCIISEDMVQKMKEGAIIIDVSIDQGGCVETSKETTHSNPVYKMHGITHYCVPNIASMVPRTASISVSNYLLPLIIAMGEMGGLENFLQSDPGFSKGVYLFNGTMTNRQVSEKYTIPFQNLELLMAAFY